MKNKNKGRSYYVLIPAYQPKHNLEDIVTVLLTKGKHLSEIVVIDDGSTLTESARTFMSLQDPTNVRVLRNSKNLGKGAALKVGMAALLKVMTVGDILVTADADGQHLPEDIIAVADYALKRQHSTLGCRTFKGYVPWRSRIGNFFIAMSLFFVTGKRLKDTQTGLRALTYEDCQELLHLEGDGYEYEFNCLIHLLKNKKKTLKQYPITLVYEPGNPTSHFNPVLDSIKIYFTFLRYISVSLLAAIVDISIFTSLTLLHIKTLPALIIARVFSLPIYFVGMRNAVFKSRQGIVSQFFSTCVLVCINIIYLWQFIDWLESSFEVYRWLAMAIGSILFFVANFLIQNYILYPEKESK